MKSKIKILALFLALIVSAILFPKQSSAQQSAVSFQIFYDQLSPYGEWVDYPNYGYVWIPDEGSDFVPYSTQGHWIFTAYGWTWVSGYRWGWAPFHYGRWDYDNYYGWFWVPDNEWGPSWVTWRRANGYYGWAPMEPGISISVSFGRSYDSHHDHWIFVRDRDIERPDINRYHVNSRDHDRIIRNSTVINKTYVDNSRHTTYVAGPAREDVQRVTGRRISPVAIRENNKPGQVLSNGQLKIYRPQVTKNNSNVRRPAPSRITNIKDVKRPSERKATNQQKNVNPQRNNNTRVQPSQPRNVNPQNNKNNKARPSQPRNVNPANTNTRQPNTVSPRNINNHKVQPSQPRNVNQSPQKTGKQQPNTAKPSKNKRNEPPKESQPGQDKKRTD